jgi:molybdopterin synthase sulfur carrier subunit
MNIDYSGNASRSSIETVASGVKVSIPPVLRKVCGDVEAVSLRPGTILDLVNQLHHRFNGVRDRICDEKGRLRGSVLIFVNGEDVRFLDHQATQVQDGDEVSIIPAFAGG